MTGKKGTKVRFKSKRGNPRDRGKSSAKRKELEDIKETESVEIEKENWDQDYSDKLE